MEEKKVEDKKETPSFLKAKSVKDGFDHLMISNEPKRFSAKDIDDILIHAFNNGVSDVSIQSNLPIIFQIYGNILKVSKHTLEDAEVSDFITRLHGESAITTLNTGVPLDKRYSIRDEKDFTKYYFYRLNTTKQNKGFQTTARIIPSDIPYLSDMKLDKELEYNLLNFKKGMALITGATGSGKSTLLASIIAEFLRNEKYQKKIITAEAPVEFDLEQLNAISKHSFVSQSEIPNDLASFAKATENALRRAPNIILIGEARDPETIRGATVASMTGHEVFTTVHSNGFVDTFRRMMDEFPENEKSGAFSALITNTKIVLSQQLVPSLDGKRVALREYVILNDEIKEILQLGGPDKLTYNCKKVLDKYGYSFAQDAKKKFEEGLISEEEYKKVVLGIRVISEANEEIALKENMEVEILKALKTTMDSLSEQSKATNLLLTKLFDLEERVNSMNFMMKNKNENLLVNEKENKSDDVDLNF